MYLTDMDCVLMKPLPQKSNEKSVVKIEFFYYSHDQFDSLSERPSEGRQYPMASTLNFRQTEVQQGPSVFDQSLP